MVDGSRVERSEKRVRVMLGGEIIVDSTSPWLVWEKPYFPTYFFPLTDVANDRLGEIRDRRENPGLGAATFYTVKGGDREGIAYRYLESPVPQLVDTVAFRWNSMDHWFEEDEEVYVHARDPYVRIDILHSSRHVTVEVEGEQVADSHQPMLLFETGLPTRYYLPKTDLRMDLLTPSERNTECPYKGTASYWSLEVGGKTFPDFVWSYPFPTLESAKIAGLLCFYNEKVDLTIDGIRQERPRSPFS